MGAILGIDGNFFTAPIGTTFGELHQTTMMNEEAIKAATLAAGYNLVVN
jgi:hypothetical protein